MDNYKFDIITRNDIDKILDIYNSNTSFLENHMGISTVSKEFIINEIEEMINIGFNSLVIKNSDDNILGICDFKIEDDVNLITLFQTKSTNEIKDYMDKHYKDLAKTYNLENPRTTLDDSMVRLAKKKIKKH